MAVSWTGREQCRLWCCLRIAARRECLRPACAMRRKQGGQLESLADRDRFTHPDCATILAARSRRRNQRKRQHTRPVQTTSRAEVSSTGAHFLPKMITGNCFARELSSFAKQETAQFLRARIISCAKDSLRCSPVDYESSLQLFLSDYNGLRDSALHESKLLLIARRTAARPNFSSAPSR